MVKFICAVRDVKSEAYGNPFFVRTLGEAIRSFQDEVNRENPDNMLCTHYKDFTLFTLGKFDDSDGSIESITPKVLIQGDQVKHPTKDNGRGKISAV